jgi:hypothetical protein
LPVEPVIDYIILVVASDVFKLAITRKHSSNFLAHPDVEVVVPLCG